MNSVKKIFGGLGLLAAVVLLCWTGKELGKRSARAGWFHGSPSASTAGFSSIPPRPRSRAESIGISSSLTRLKHMLAGQVLSLADFERMVQLRAELSKLSAAELAEMLKWTNQGLRSNGWILRREILAVWIQLDPAAACLAAHELRGGALDAAFSGSSGVLMDRIMVAARGEALYELGHGT